MNVNISEDNKSPLSGLQPNYDFINNYGTNPIMIGILLVVVVGYYFIISFSSKTDASSVGSVAEGVSSSSGTSSTSLLETLLWILFITLLVINGVRYFYDIDISTSIKGIFSSEPEVDIEVSNIGTVAPQPGPEPPVPEITYEKQVFHVSDNSHTFEDARAICAAYGARLATYDEVEAAQRDGAEWCSYGWSQDQLALYPTQKSTYDKLQKIKGHEHDCGRPGVNGGYIANPKVKYGANCYGYKPEITPEERKKMEIDSLYPKTKKEIRFDKKVEEWRRKLGQVLVSPFNRTTWSKV